MAFYIVAVGSNIEPTFNIEQAFKKIKAIDENACIASLLNTKAVGFTEQANFINTAFSFHSQLDATNLKRKLLLIEEQLSRVRTNNKNGPRTIDLDIVKINDDIVDDDYHRYDFVKKSVDALTNDC